jgi:hypothetical protein
VLFVLCHQGWHQLSLLLTSNPFHFGRSEYKFDCTNRQQSLTSTWGDFSLCSMDVYLELLGASTQLAICSKSPCSIAISSRPYLQDAISSSLWLQLSRKVVRTRSEHLFKVYCIYITWVTSSAVVSTPICRMVLYKLNAFFGENCSRIEWGVIPVHTIYHQR